MTRIATACLLALLVGAAGCKQGTGGQGSGATGQAPQGGGEQLGGSLGPGPAGGSYTVFGKSRDRAVELQIMNGLRNLGQAYIQHETLNNEGPANVEELGTGVSPMIKDFIKKGDLVVYWKVRLQHLPEGKSYTVLAYDKRAKDSGGVVLMADGSASRMTKEQFAKAPKAGR